MKKLKNIWKRTDGYAVVEATILFPIIIMVFAGLVLLSMYLPTRAVLQRATQYAATAIATEQSDTWLSFDAEEMKYRIESKRELKNVYVALISALSGTTNADDAEEIIVNFTENGIVHSMGNLTVQCNVVNYVIYKEIVITATETIPNPVNLSFVGFPTQIPITVTSTAVVQNGDEFVRNMDLAADFVGYLAEKYNIDLDEMFGFVDKIWDFLGV